MAAVEPAYRYIETLPGGVSHEIFKLRDNGRLDNTPEVTVPPGRLFVMGDNRDNSADSRVPVRDGGVGLLPMDDLVGRADAVVGSWDLGIRSQPVWTWLSGFRVRAVFHRGALRHVIRGARLFGEPRGSMRQAPLSHAIASRLARAALLRHDGSVARRQCR